MNKRGAIFEKKFEYKYVRGNLNINCKPSFPGWVIGFNLEAPSVLILSLTLACVGMRAWVAFPLNPNVGIGCVRVGYAVVGLGML